MVANCTALNVAMIERFVLIVTLHVPVPEHPPPVQPPNIHPEVGVAVSTTEVPWAKFPVHVGAQLIPTGLETTLPPPETETLKVMPAVPTVTIPFASGPEAASRLELPSRFDLYTSGCPK